MIIHRQHAREVSSFRRMMGIVINAIIIIVVVALTTVLLSRTQVPYHTYACTVVGVLVVDWLIVGAGGR